MAHSRRNCVRMFVIVAPPLQLDSIDERAMWWCKQERGAYVVVVRVRSQRSIINWTWSQVSEEKMGTKENARANTVEKKLFCSRMVS